MLFIMKYEFKKIYFAKCNKIFFLYHITYYVFIYILLTFKMYLFNYENNQL